MQEEPFGPLALTGRFGDIAEAIAEANRLPYGLAAYAFTGKRDHVARIRAEVESGMIGINNFSLTWPETPFGGVKDSGYGSEGGSEGLDAYISSPNSSARPDVTSSVVQPDSSPEPRKFSRKAAALILDYLNTRALEEGAHITESGLAAALNVSRTPIRAALEQLKELKVVAPAGPRRGYYISASAERIRGLAQQPPVVDDEEGLYLAIAQDLLNHRIAEQFSEADMLRHYGVGRSLLTRELQRMASDRVIERNPAYGWRFESLLKSAEAHDDGYRFRMIVEPAALEEPGFTLDPLWAERTRREHEATLATPPRRLSMVRFFAMNANFHEMLAAASGNVFFHRAVQQQN